MKTSDLEICCSSGPDSVVPGWFQVFLLMGFGYAEATGLGSGLASKVLEPWLLPPSLDLHSSHIPADPVPL